MAIFLAFILGLSIVTCYIPVKKQNLKEQTIYTGFAENSVKIIENIKPISEFKDEFIVKQTYDYSCGSAALATILKYYLNEDFSEKQLIRGLLRFGDKEKIIKRRAFSLLDMKKFVKVIGYKGVGYKAEIEDLKGLGMPSIIPITIFGYNHFVVLKGIYKNHVFIADPSLGNISFTVKEFEKMWYKNILFVVYPEGGLIKNNLKLANKDLKFISDEILMRTVFNYDQPLSNRQVNDMREKIINGMIIKLK